MGVFAMKAGYNEEFPCERVCLLESRRRTEHSQLALFKFIFTSSTNASDLKKNKNYDILIDFGTC